MAAIFVSVKSDDYPLFPARQLRGGENLNRLEKKNGLQPYTFLRSGSVFPRRFVSVKSLA